MSVEDEQEDTSEVEVPPTKKRRIVVKPEQVALEEP